MPAFAERLPSQSLPLHRRPLHDLLLRLFAVVSLLLALSAQAAEPRVDVTALFDGRAMLEVDGTQRFVRVGETTPEGVTLVHADTAGARIRIGAVEHDLALTRRIGGSYAAAPVTEVPILRDASGMYRVHGRINSRSTDFLIDTGASMVAMSEMHARRLGIDVAGARERVVVATAQGETEAVVVMLDDVEVGSIRISHVRAIVLPGNHPHEVLLGMSFLSEVRLEDRAGVLMMLPR